MTRASASSQSQATARSGRQARRCRSRATFTGPTHSSRVIPAKVRLDQRERSGAGQMAFNVPAFPDAPHSTRVSLSVVVGEVKHPGLGRQAARSLQSSGTEKPTAPIRSYPGRRLVLMPHPGGGGNLDRDGAVARAKKVLDRSRTPWLE